MKSVRAWLTEPGMESAVEELKSAVLEHYPDATFALRSGDDPEGLFVVATIDVEDSTDVIAAISNQLFDIQVERYLPVYVVALRPIPDVAAANVQRRDSAVA